MPTSRLKAEIARILQSEGYIQGFKLLDETKRRLGRRQDPAPVSQLRSPWGEADHRDRAHQSSRPPSLLWTHDVPEVLAGLGTSILTTSRGVMTGREAVKAGVGGELLCNVW